jgi:hypothetical protein
MFAKIENGAVTQYPYTPEQMRQDNPNTSFTKNPAAETLAAFGVVSVGYQAAPEYNPDTQRLEHSALPVLVDGAWVLTKTVVDKTAEQLQIDTANKASQVRSERNKKLTASDWTQIADSTADKALWATYRQALRDITSQAGFPWTIEWPEQP